MGAVSQCRFCPAQTRPSCQNPIYNCIYYFVINEEDTFIPEFPKEYDTLIIEYGESKWSIERNKLIERFIRKSVRIDNMIKYDFDRYILNFYLNAEKVYSIEYNDLRFPESAVKIMTDQIINKL